MEKHFLSPRWGCVFGWVFSPGLRGGLTATLALGCDLSTASRLFRQWLFLPETRVCSKSAKGAKEHKPGASWAVRPAQPRAGILYQDPSSERATEDRLVNAKMTLLQKVGDYFLRIHAMELHCIFPTSVKVNLSQALYIFFMACQGIYFK